MPESPRKTVSDLLFIDVQALTQPGSQLAGASGSLVGVARSTVLTITHAMVILGRGGDDAEEARDPRPGPAQDDLERVSDIARSGLHGSRIVTINRPALHQVLVRRHNVLPRFRKQRMRALLRFCFDRRTAYFGPNKAHRCGLALQGVLVLGSGFE